MARSTSGRRIGGRAPAECAAIAIRRELRSTVNGKLRDPADGRAREPRGLASAEWNSGAVESEWEPAATEPAESAARQPGPSGPRPLPANHRLSLER